MDALPFIQYRNIRAAANAPAHELANLDAHIAGILAANPPCLVTMNVQMMGKPKFTVSVDISKHTVDDLADRIGATLGHHPGRLRLIHKGRHADYPGALCRDVGIHDGALINVCLKSGCPGYGCCDATYNMLGDALLRQATTVASSGVLTNLPPEELDKVFALISKMEAAKPLARKACQGEAAPEAKGAAAAWGGPALRSIWPKDLCAALLATDSNSEEALCEVLPKTCVAEAMPPSAKLLPRTPSATSMVGQDAKNVVLPGSDDEDIYS